MDLSTLIERAANLIKAGQREEALVHLDTLLARTPEHPIILHLYGTLLLESGKIGASLAMLTRAAQNGPKYDFVWKNLGGALRKAQHYDVSRQAYQTAHKLNPDDPDVMAMLAGSHVNVGDPGPGIEWARKALIKDPLNSHAWNHLALCLLENGQWKEGWKAYERRWAIPNRKKDARDYGGVRKWRGRKVETLAIHGEQGLGDEILFLSCLPELRDRAKRIVIECAGRLVPLITRSFDCPVYATHAELISAEQPDAWIPIGDLPRFVRNSPADFERQPAAYLRADPVLVKEYRVRLAALGPRPWVGIAWWGGTPETHSRLRCTELADWRPVRKAAGACISLQYGDVAPQVAAEAGLTHWQDAIDDLDRTAALCEALDLVISVPQTIVHIAGALGRPTWVATPAWTCWRFAKGGDRCLWHPSAKLYRQERSLEWKPVLNRMGADLANFGSLPGTKSAAA